MTINPDANPWEQAARAFELPSSLPTPGALALRVNPRHTVQTAALELIDAALVDLINTPDGRLIITMPPQEGKSTRVAKDFPTWALTQRPTTRIVTASYGQGLANRNGRAVRNLILANPSLGLRIAPDNGAAAEWEILSPAERDAGHADTGDDDPQRGGIVSVGIGAGLTGRPADLLIIDDPIKDRKEADSELVRQRVWDWWTDVAATRLAPGAPVVVILTRWHEEDLAGKLLAAEDGHTWRVLNIPAEADHDPANGETDPLGREVGEFMESARGRTDAQWAAIKVRSGSRSWASLYQGRPRPAKGTIFQSDWFANRYTIPLWLVREDGAHVTTGFDQLLQSWDLAFKDSEGTDWVVGQVWGRRAGEYVLLDQVRGHWDFPETLRQFTQLTARWPQALLKIVEDKANGPALIAMLRRTIPGIVAEEPQGGKVARATAVAPFAEARNVVLPDDTIAPWVGGLVDELVEFPSGKHDDQVDAFSQGLNRIALQPLLTDTQTLDELDPELADYGSYIPG